MTYGEKAVGLTFNPNGDQRVQKLKELYAEIIDLIARSDLPQWAAKEAIHQAITAQMWAVKAVTWQGE